MASFSNKITDFLHSPKTKEMVNKAKAAANRPENRAKIKQLQAKLTSRGHGHHDAGPASPAGSSTAGYTDATRGGSSPVDPRTRSGH
ncbi:hypothetical protein CcI156_00700 [Frankia sp. CcI156]|jgi:hypothetical protein|uniref:Uncharacterized protein n=1 Tax=Frankia casuarinae (strain DSM 45818 / CECT 9043 / HFP020203 / CcI3) TaxID=106370 RepID=Q2JFM6_FRACC|nr:MULTISPECIES: hypothetical protein [Frankia]ABD09916.1 hypothetical protein Francci3_0532 [Frankia casuarinae]ETA04375.1 hypothetical protein CcI6DRAFT_00149 [Frankia sp. CcI6]EYT89861.1 hypothetical protein ThrDRAFT_04527 [Frankia casuarinae]KDA44927.1 hypothetical protein BMG523Draft_00051 [Frankia sp. BMG5.23]KFB06578.1 hypothetical protein ALLO2DRAFT_00620 [Frankia sp. Allo2]